MGITVSSQFFKYIYGSATLEREAGMTAAGWVNKDAGDRIGGIPTTLNDALQLSEKNEQSKELLLITSVRDALFVSSEIDKSRQTIFFVHFCVAGFFLQLIVIWFHLWDYSMR